MTIAQGQRHQLAVALTDLVRGSGGGIEAITATSKVSRIAAKELKGLTDDPWAPVKADRSSSVTASGAGFGYRAMARLLRRSETTRPLLGELHKDDPREGLSIVAAALVRGQGKTEGLHRRAIRVTRIEQLEDGGEEPLDRIGDVATRRAAEAGEAARRLRRALMVLVQGGPEQARLDDDAAAKKIEPWTKLFDKRVDDGFFDASFWSEAADDPANHERAWREHPPMRAGGCWPISRPSCRALGAVRRTRPAAGSARRCTMRAIRKTASFASPRRAARRCTTR